MSIDSWAARLREPELASRVVLAICLIYAVSFFAFYPRVVTNDDESMYRRQTALLLRGTASITQIEPLTGEQVVHYPSRYPPGTALSMAPFVAVAGWRGAYLVPFLAVMVAVLALGRWLADAGRSPLFALLILGYPPTLVMGRVGMSDVPSMGMVTVGLWLFFRGLARGPSWWLGSGFVAGLSMLFRDSNPILFTPFYAGTVLRRDRGWWALLVGGLLGLTGRVGANLYFFGEPLYGRSKYHLALATLDERLPVYLLATLVFVPGGLVLSLLYRGRRWPELRIGVAAFFTAYLIQKYFTWATSSLKRMIITPRYLLPLVPVMAFGMAESVPRLWGRLLERCGAERRARLERWGARAVLAWTAAVALAALCVHPVFYVWSETQAHIRDAIVARVDEEAVLVTNYMATRKFLNELDRTYRPVDARKIAPDDANALVRRYGEIYVAFVDRNDSPHWRGDIEKNADFVAGLVPPPQLLLDEEMSPTDRLRIWRVTAAPAE